MKKNSLVNSISDTLEISRDILVTMPKIVIMGNGMITVEGFVGLVEYGEEKAVVKTKSGGVVIEGGKLAIDEITEERITLKGDISHVQFL